MHLSTRVPKLFMLLLILNILLAFPVLAWKPDYRPPPEQLKKMEKINETSHVHKK